MTAQEAAAAESELQAKEEELRAAQSAKEAAEAHVAANPGDAEAEKKADEALKNFRRIEREYQAKQREAAARRQTAQCQPGTSSINPEPPSGYYQFTENKSAAVTFLYDSKHGNISDREAVTITLPECIAMPYDNRNKCFSGAVCETYKNWLPGLKGGVKCVCQFSDTSGKTLYIMPRPGELKERDMHWPNKLRGLRGGAP